MSLLVKNIANLLLRFYTGLPLLNDVKTSVAGIKPVDFKLTSLPLYLIGQAKRLCHESI